MPRRWTEPEEREKREELIELYVRQNKTIFEIGPILNLAPGGVYSRLVRFGIATQSKHPGKTSHNSRILDIPPLSGDLAEFCGVLLGDGHITARQFFITVNVKTDALYVPYLQNLVEGLFDFRPRIAPDKGGVVVDLFVTSTHLVGELRRIGLYSTNKVRDQVGIPGWIFDSAEYQRRFVRGFFDTDGSVYLLKHFNAIQMLFKNRSIPLLEGTRQILLNLGYHPSMISGFSVYLTQRMDTERYAWEIGFGNPKHLERFERFRDLRESPPLFSRGPGVVRERQAQYHSEQWVTAPLTLN